MTQCDLSNPEFVYFYCPSYAAAILFSVLFTATTVGHVYQGWMVRRPFTLVLIMAGLWEVVGYAIRAVSTQNPYTSGLYTGQMLLILLAPLWINAFVYMLVGRMIHFFHEDDRIFGLKARRMTMVFVIFDIIAFLVQGTGGSMSSSTDLNTALTGLNVYTGGVALQLAFNTFFLAVVGSFHKKSAATLLRNSSRDVAMNDRSSDSDESSQPHIHSFADAMWLLKLVYGIMIIIFFRNFYRLAEFASGLNNTIIKNEWYAYVFDAVPMLAAMIIFNIFHPSRKLNGPRSDFSVETKARKQARKDKKAAKKEGRSLVENKEPTVSTREISNDNRV